MHRQLLAGSALVASFLAPVPVMAQPSNARQVFADECGNVGGRIVKGPDVYSGSGSLLRADAIQVCINEPEKSAVLFFTAASMDDDYKFPDSESAPWFDLRLLAANGTIVRNFEHTVVASVGECGRYQDHMKVLDTSGVDLSRVRTAEASMNAHGRARCGAKSGPFYDVTKDKIIQAIRDGREIYDAAKQANGDQ